MRRILVFVLAFAAFAPVGAQRAAVSNRPDTPFKLATFAAAEKTRVGLVLGTRVLDIAGANVELTQKAGVAAVRIPGEMRAPIDAYARVSPRLYQIDPVLFAKSPRSCVIDPGEAYTIPPGRNIDWEGELAIIIGKPAFKVTEIEGIGTLRTPMKAAAAGTQ